MADIETHVHYRPGGAVADKACRCANPTAWPIRADDVVASPPEELPTRASRAAEPAPPAARNRQRPVVRVWLVKALALARSAAARVARAGRLVARSARTAARGAWAICGTVGDVILAVISAVGGGAQVAGVAIASWAAWDIDPLAGRLVLAAGLLFLGGAIARIAKEVRNGHR